MLDLSRSFKIKLNSVLTIVLSLTHVSLFNQAELKIFKVTKTKKEKLLKH